MEHLAARTLYLNTIGVVNFSTDCGIVFEPYKEVGISAVSFL